MLLRRRSILVVLGLVMLAGCRFKGGESFVSATDPNPPFDASGSEWKGDRYAASTLSEPSGGTKPASTYAVGARQSGDQRIDPMLNRPSYGTGQGENELGNSATAGHEQTNAPVFQGAQNRLPVGP